MRVEQIGAATLYLGNAREIMPTLARPDAIMADPPYGQAVNVNIACGMTGATLTGGRARLPNKRYPSIMGDDAPFDPAWLFDYSDKLLLWGAHKFGHALPPGRWLGWDKVPTGKRRDQGDGEMAWTNVLPTAPLRLFRHLWDGLSIAGGYETRIERTGGAAAKRVHPTQKPVDLMTWCLGFLGLTPNSLIADPYMGGGSTGIAAVRAGHRFVGMEIEQRYFDAACRRIEQAQLIEARAATQLARQTRRPH